MEQNLLERLYACTCGVFDRYDLEYTGHCVTDLLERWWVQQRLAGRSAA